MPYTPNNPYIPGDPYSYDLKWLVSQVKANRAALEGLDDRIKDVVISQLDQHDPVYYQTAQELIDSTQKAGSIAFIEGYSAPGDMGANLYYVTDDYNDIIGAYFYITLSGSNRWAVPIILTPYVMPEMFGGNTEAELATALKYKLPVYMTGTYEFSSPVTLTENDEIIGTSRTVINCSSGAFIISGRRVKIEDLIINGASSDIALLFSASGVDAHRGIFRNITIADFNIGIEFDTTTWDCSFADIRVDRCSKGIYTPNTTGHMANTFINVYFNACAMPLDLKAVRESSFIGCNFGISGNGAFNFEQNCRIKFQSCNFECDNQSVTADIFTITSEIIVFDSCVFKIYGSSTAYVMAFYNPIGVVFNNCTYQALTGSTLGGFFNPARFSTIAYGAIKLTGASNLIPDPDFSSVSNPNKPNFKNDSRGLPIYFVGNTITLSKLRTGCLLYQMDTGKLCWFNGTNIVDMAGTIIV